MGFRLGVECLGQPYRSLVESLLRALLESWGENLVSLVVFGSVARGDARRDSDIDLLVVGRRLPRGILKRLALFEDAEERVRHLIEGLWDKGYYTDFSPVILSVEEALRTRPLYLDMVYDAVIVYDRDHFIESILRELAGKLERLGARRVWIGKRWYWVLKRDYRFGEVIEI